MNTFCRIEGLLDSDGLPTEAYLNVHRIVSLTQETDADKNGSWRVVVIVDAGTIIPTTYFAPGKAIELAKKLSDVAKFSNVATAGAGVSPTPTGVPMPPSSPPDTRG